MVRTRRQAASDAAGHVAQPVAMGSEPLPGPSSRASDTTLVTQPLRPPSEQPNMRNQARASINVNVVATPLEKTALKKRMKWTQSMNKFVMRSYY